MMKKRYIENGVEVVINSIVVEEDLPYPFVHYPNHYGTFVGFSKKTDEKPTLCLCCKSSVENYLKLSERKNENNSNPLRLAPLGSFDFPDSLADLSLKSDESPLSWLSFEPDLCHRCQMKIPTHSYCHPMYGGKFKQTYGFYINQNSYKLGVDRSYKFIEEITPDEVKELILQLNDQDTNPSKIERKINNVFENETRKEFGIRKIGDAWVSESILFQIISNLYPKEEIVRHLRPQWLDGLELDIYIPNIRLAFEYQGQQHYHPVKHWGGESALKKVKERDLMKKRMCEDLGISLLQIDYREPLLESHIRSRINETKNPNKTCEGTA